MASDIDQCKFNETLNNVELTCVRNTDISPTQFMQLSQAMRKRNKQFHRGKPYWPVWKMQSYVSPHSHSHLVDIYKSSEERNLFSMIGGSINMSPCTGEWLPTQKQKTNSVHVLADEYVYSGDTDPLHVYDEVNIDFTLSSKISVWKCALATACVQSVGMRSGIRTTQLKHTMSRKYAQRRCSGETSMQEVSACRFPKAISARYKTVNALHSLDCSPVEVNILNVNMSRDIHSFIVQQRVLAAHCAMSRNLDDPAHDIVKPLLDRVTLNNSSATLDAFVNSVVNEQDFMSATALATDNKHVRSVPMRTFKTRKTVYNIEKNANTYHRKGTNVLNATQNIKPYSGRNIQLQLHPRSLNSSAVPLLALVEPLQQFGIQLFRSPTILMDVTLTQCKEFCTLISHSMITRTMNVFCELLCRSLCTYKYKHNRKLQMFIFRGIARRCLEKLFSSRDSYAHAGLFAMSSMTGRLYVKDDCEMVSRIYGTLDTVKMFAHRKANPLHTTDDVSFTSTPYRVDDSYFTELYTMEPKCRKRKAVHVQECEHAQRKYAKNENIGNTFRNIEGTLCTTRKRTKGFMSLMCTGTYQFANAMNPP